MRQRALHARGVSPTGMHDVKHDAAVMMDLVPVSVERHLRPLVKAVGRDSTVASRVRDVQHRGRQGEVIRTTRSHVDHHAARLQQPAVDQALGELVVGKQIAHER
ncbi:MAG: hypothetical protein EBV29_01685, partial [Gammaproteobacteria bacterium]|nr:hypothetical protein [Gammaproteobacteria bacterium]